MAGQLSTIRLSRYDAQPWGFRLQGGLDFGTPLIVQKVNGGSLAEQAGLLAGDALLKVNNVDVYNMRHKDAQDLIVRSGNSFDITIQRGGSVWRPQVTPTGSLPSPSSHIANSVPTVTKTSLSHKPQEVRHIGSGYNSAARPFSSVNGSDGQVKSIVNKQYNTPVGIYSEEAIAETLSAQAEVLAGGVLGVNFKKNEKIYNAANSEVLKMLHEQENDPEPDTQGPSSPVTKHVTAPIDRPKAPNTGGLPTGQNICAECERLIVGVFVRIKDKNLHSECFKCATCGTNLKNQGYFNFNNKLYCDIHARLAAMNNPPKGTEGYTPVPIKPATKLSASTISAALDSHTQHNGSGHESNANITSIMSPLSHTHSRTSSSSSSIHSSAGISSSHSTMSSLSPDKSTMSPEKLSPAHSRQSSENGSTNVFGHHQLHPISGAGAIRTNSRTMSPVMSSPPPPPPPPLPFDSISPPAATITYSNEITINHKRNENDVNNGSKINNNGVVECNANGGQKPNNGGCISNGYTNGGHDSHSGSINGAPETGGDSGQHVLPQTNVYNKFLKKYANKMQSDFLDGSNHKSNPATTPSTTTRPTEITTSKSDKINDSSENNNLVKMASTLSTPFSSTTNGYVENGESIYGTIRPESRRKSNEDFKYVTLDGSVIRSVIPPGKGVKTNYKLNTGYGGPKPFNSSPMSPPMRGPQSPSTYPPPTSVQSWDQPRSQPKPQVNPYATLPRTTGHSQEESRQQCLTYEQQIHEQEQYHQERSVFEEDLEIIEANRPQPGHFMWPPPVDENRCTPTATPLYIPPPGTQHVVPKPVTEKPPEQQWQSRSAPELTSGQQKGVEIESSSDSYTSTSTTTTTTSEEYQRMYQAQVQAYQMQQAYEQSCSEMDYHMDMEVAATYQDQSFSSANYYSSQSGRKSAQECVEYISGPVSTYHLIDLVRAATPKPETPPPKPPRKVEFSDEIRIQQTEKSVTENTSEMTKAIKEKYEEMQQNQRKEKSQEDQTKTTEEDLRIERAEVSADNRKFAATPEIKIEIPEVKPIPPSNIPNPVPKEWVSPMVKALTTAPDKPVEIAETSQSEATRTFESVQFKVEEDIKKEKTVQTESTKLATEPQILHEEPPKGSFLTKTMTTAPTDKIKFVERSDEPISLPEETQPYMPPPIDMKPYYRDDYRPKSPFLDALTIAPDRSYTPYGHDVCSQLLDLPTAKEKLTMVDALTVAPPRCYTPLNSSNATTLAEEQKKEKGKYQYYTKDENVTKQSIDTEINRQISAFANVKGSNGNTTFQPRRESLNSHATNTNHSLIPQNQSIQSQRQDSHQSQDRITNTQKQSMFQSVSSATTASAVATSYHSMNQTSCSKTSTTCKKEQQQQQCQTSTATKQQHHQQTEHDFEQKISFPPPPGPMAKKMVLSGLHKPDSIPQYQRNWTVLPSQRPVRTPEPPELKENVPLAFVETPTPRELTPSIEPSAQMKTTTSNSTASSSYQQHEATLTATKVSESRQQQQYQQIQQSKEQMSRSTLPIIVTENDAPVTMAFQSLDVDHGESQSRPYTPSLINKPAPIIPYYQTPAKLVAEECSATQARLYDPRSPSPLPDRARSPAPGPPPNPLSAIRAPRLKEPSYEVAPNYRPPIQAGSITTGQSYYGTQQAQFQTVEQGNVVSHYQTGYQAGSQSFIDKPEVVQQRQIGNTTIQTREKESKMNEENRSAMETKSTTQVGNMQIERRRKVVEEFEHTQTAKSIEIRKTHGDDSKQTTQYHQAGRTGFVANQARRLSNLEQEISSVSSQSQAISARAANLAESSDSIFPHYKSPEPDSKFPIKTYLPPHDEPSRATYVVSADATNKLVGNSAAHKADTSAKVASHTYATLSSQQQHQSFSQGQSISSGAAKSSITNASSSISSAAATSSAASATFGTDASKLTTTTSTAIPVPAFKLPTPFTSTGGPSADQLLNNANQQAPPLAQSQATTNNAAYKPPTSGLGPAGFKAPPPPTSSISVPNVVNDPSPASAGPTSKGGAFGATSAPKRGRGILNKAVGPGVRIPMCGCCHAQIRGPFITALGRIWCPDHFVCVNANCRRPLQDIGFVEEKGELYCEFCFERYLAPTCSKCANKIKGDCLNAIGKHYHPECFTCSYCGKLFGNSPFFLEEGEPYCEADWNELFTTKCFACGFPVEAGDRWVEALNHNYHSQCFNCTMCKKNLEGQSFYNKGGRPFCKNHAR